MRRSLLTCLLGAGLVFGSAGCGSDPEPAAEPATATVPGITEVRQKLSDGRTVVCLLWDEGSGYDSGMSCDWANAKPAGTK